MTSKSLVKVRRTQKLVQSRLLDNQERQIHDQYKIIEIIEEFLYDSTIIHTDRNYVPAITSWEVEAALQDMKTGKATSNDLINIETFIA